MKYSIEIGKVVEGALKQDKQKVENYTKLLIEKLNQDGEERVAKKLALILEKNSNEVLSSMEMSKIMKTPVDFESRIPMADVIMPTDSDTNVILSNRNQEAINTFLLSYRKSDKLYSVGLDVPNTLLMYGPPGCGKTKCAEFIANQLKLPLVVARLDSMISSYLGTTAKNIRNLFEYAQKTPCILFLDEFDAIAKARDDNNELGELKRVVNSLLQNIDSLDRNTLLIAATNHESLLDKAIWRRFNYRLKVELPDYNSRVKLISLFLKNLIEVSDKDLNLLSLIMDGMSGAYIEEIINKSIHKSIIYEKELRVSDIFEEVLEEKISFEEDNDDKLVLEKKARYLRAVDDKVFSYAVIGDILNVSKSKISTILK